MQTTGLPSSSHPVPTRNTTDNSASENARAAAKFSEAMHRALGGPNAKSYQQTNQLVAEEAAPKNKSDSDEISADKKHPKAKRNSQPASTSAASPFLGMAGASSATPQPVAPIAGNAHDSDESKGSTPPISDDSAKPETIEAASTDDAADAKAVDQSAEATPSNDTPAAETQISAESPEHAPAAGAAATQALAAQAIEPDTAPVNPAEALGEAEANPLNGQVIGSKTPLAQAGAPPSAAHGTSAAKQDMTMKKADKTPKVAGQMEQDLPGITATGGDDLPKGQKLSTKEAALGSEKLETAAVEMPLRVLTSSDSPAPTVTAVDPAPAPALDSRVLERTHDIVAMHAMRVGEYTSDSMHVVVKPGAGIQLSLELRQSARGIEVHASLHKGDFDQLSQHWPDLQQRLEARGVRMGSLTTSEDFSSTSQQQFQQSKQQSPNQDPLYAGAFAEFALAGSMTEEPAARAARATAYRGWETWA